MIYLAYTLLGSKVGLVEGNFKNKNMQFALNFLHLISNYIDGIILLNKQAV